MHTTTHPLPPSQTAQAEALAELHAATLVIDNPAHTTTASEFAAPTAPQTATWYAAEDTRPALTDALATMGHTNLVWTPVDTTADYVAQTAHLFPPLQVGRFYITRNHEAPPTGCIPIQIPPNQAFGSGEHATTSGCLTVFQHLLHKATIPATSAKPASQESVIPTQVGIHEQHQTRAAGAPSIQYLPTHALDFGAGSAILALATATWLGIPVTCADNEQPAVRIALENAATNGVSHLITSHHADTPAHPAVMANAPYPLVFANILLTPLLTLSKPLINTLAPNGILILSGFRTDQEADILTAYTSLTLLHRHEADGWLTLALQRL
ncbi:MAG: 50S ribosomal protein L11 methyltransferase [Pseudomonadaceae bacterium]|nr:50S ribosomal protein L11 methyltransferase [Pseudomonadaceae bacterium]